MAKYYVGQKLWAAPRHGMSEHGREVAVKIVGSQWVTLDDNSRFLVKDCLPAKCANYSWQVFESEEHADRYRRTRNNWAAFCAHLRNSAMPADMTTDKIVAAAKLLGIDVEIVSSKEANDG